MPRSLRRLLPLAVGLASAFATSSAFAQTILVTNEGSLPRLGRSGTEVQKRAANLQPEAVNLQDCLDDQKIRFTLELSGIDPNAKLETWAGYEGTDCKQLTSRQSATQVCWPLVSEVPLRPKGDVDISVRKILSGAPPFTPQTPEEGPGACGKIDLARIAVQFLYFDSGQPATASISSEVGITVDTIGPAPPTGPEVSPGNARLKVRFSNLSGEGGVSVLSAMKAYCDVAGASGCASPNFAPLAGGVALVPDAEFDRKYECGSTTDASNTLVASAVAGRPLANGTRYAVALSATDAFGNPGPLSTLACGTPDPAMEPAAEDDSGCGVAPTRMRVGGAGALASAFALVLASIVRARTSRRRA